MGIGETVLRALSKAPGGDYIQHDPIAADLNLLKRTFPELLGWIHGKRVVDHGCGEGL